MLIRQRNVEVHQRLLDIAARADAREGIRQGLEDARKGRTRPAEEFFKEFERTVIAPDIPPASRSQSLAKDAKRAGRRRR